MLPAHSIIIPTRDRVGMLGVALNMLLRVSPEDTEIIVVDNGLRGDDAEFAKKLSCRVLHEPDASVTQSINSGARIANADRLIVMHNDLLLFKWPRMDKNYDIVGGVVMNQDGEWIGEYDRGGDREAMIRKHPFRGVKQPFAVDFIFTSVAKTTWNKLQGLDQKGFRYDWFQTDFCRRARYMGASIASQCIEALHIGGASTAKNDVMLKWAKEIVAANRG